MSFLEQRKEKIKSEFDNIENIKQEISTIKENYEKNLANIDDISFQKMQESINEGHKAADEIRSKAAEEAKKILNNAKEEIKLEVVKAKEQIKDQIIDLTILSTKELLQKEIDDDDDKKLIEDFLKEIEK